MDALLTPLLATRINDLWYALPLIVACGLVYAATRHELMGEIVAGALRFGAWVTGFMVAGFVLLFAISSML